MDLPNTRLAGRNSQRWPTTYWNQNRLGHWRYVTSWDLETCRTSAQLVALGMLISVLQLLNDHRSLLTTQKVRHPVEYRLRVFTNVLVAHASCPTNRVDGRELTGRDAAVVGGRCRCCLRLSRR